MMYFLCHKRKFSAEHKRISHVRSVETKDLIPSLLGIYIKIYRGNTGMNGEEDLSDKALSITCYVKTAFNILLWK